MNLKDTKPGLIDCCQICYSKAIYEVLACANRLNNSPSEFER